MTTPAGDGTVGEDADRSWTLPLIALFVGGFAIRWFVAVVSQTKTAAAAPETAA